MEFRLLEVVGRLEFVEGLVSEPGFQAAVVPWSILPVLRIGYYAVVTKYNVLTSLVLGWVPTSPQGVCSPRPYPPPTEPAVHVQSHNMCDPLRLSQERTQALGMPLSLQFGLVTTF